MGKLKAFKRMKMPKIKMPKIPKIKTLALAGIGTAVVTNNIRNPDGGWLGECGLTDIDCIFSKIKTFLMWAAIGVVVAFFLWRVFGDAANSTFEAGKQMMLKGSTRPPAKMEMKVFSPSGEEYASVTPIGGGGKNNNLDKYMYCLILLLGIGINHLYENYENKINQYLELIVK